MMQVKVLEGNIIKSLSNMGVTIIGDKVYKLNSDTPLDDVMKTVEVFEKNPSKDILLPNSFFTYTKRGKILGYEMDNLDGYLTVGEHLEEGLDFNRLNVIERVLKVMFTLLDNGLCYSDMHPYNVMIKDDDVKVIDLLGIESSDDETLICYGMIIFIFETLYADKVKFFRLATLVRNERFKKEFSKEFVKFIQDILDCSKDINPRDIYKYLVEFYDEDKNKRVRKLTYEMEMNGDFDYRFMV